ASRRRIVGESSERGPRMVQLGEIRALRNWKHSRVRIPQRLNAAGRRGTDSVSAGVHSRLWSERVGPGAGRPGDDLRPGVDLPHRLPPRERESRLERVVFADSRVASEDGARTAACTLIDIQRDEKRGRTKNAKHG